MTTQQTILTIGSIMFGTGLALGYVLWGQSENATTAIPHDMHMMPDGSLMHSSSNNDAPGMMDHSMMTVASERAFLEGMIPHHQEAVATAKEVLARGGTTPEIRQLTSDIITAQEKEIAEMQAWYQDWYGEAYAAVPGAYEPMMRDLTALSGSELDTVFLEDMIMHHMGAIMMAHSVARHIEHEEIVTLSNAIIETQTAEIALMRQLLVAFE